MKNILPPWRLLQSLVTACALLLPLSAQAMLADISDDEMAQISGQALFVADKIAPTGTGVGATTTDFTYYRVGLDARLDLNMNIDELKLGCGGVNDAIDSGVCDIDMDYVRLMGRCTTSGCGQTSPDGQAIPGAGTAASSDFVLMRPYFEFAVRNDGNRTQREIVGIKIGAQYADGYFGVGRVIARGNNPANHVGLNAISGYLNVELSAKIPLTVGSLGNSNGCIGSAVCDGVAGTPFFFDAARTTGTRMRYLQQGGIKLELEGGAASWLGDGYANLAEPMVFLHGFQLPTTDDFFLSLQRQRVSYPKYDKSGYAVAANTGWWMNVPEVKVLNLTPPRINIPCGLFGCLGALGSPGAYVEDVELNSSPPDNCFGNTLFC